MFLQEIKINYSDLFCFWVFVACGRWGWTKNKAGEDEKHFLFVCLFLSLLFFTWPQIDNLYPIFNLAYVASIAACISKWCACGISKRKPWGRVFDTGHKRVTRFRLTFFSLKDVATFLCCSSRFFSDLLLCCKQWNNSCGSLARNG